MLPLLRTLIDITFLRNGPDALPHSWLLFYTTAGLWVAVLLVTALSLETFRSRDVGIAIASALLGIACYVAVLELTGRRSRSLQTLSAIIGCGALISFAMVLVLVLFTVTAGPLFANLLAIIILFWSVPVKGHIIAKAIDQHWFAGIAIAMAVFILQYAFSATFSPEA